MITFMRHRTDPERVEAYTAWSLVGSFVVVPIVALTVISSVNGFEGEHLPWASAYLAAALAQAGFGAWTSSRAIRRLREDVMVSPTVLMLNGALALLVAALALGLEAGSGLGGRAGGVALAFAVCLMALGTALPMRVLVLLSALGAAGVAVVAWSMAPDAPDADLRYLQPLPAFISVGVATIAIVASYRFSVWLLAVVWELDRTRTAHARLAVAEERLRFSRDLHDVVGRALSAVAVKSELASALAARGQEGALEQMGEVRDLAQETLKEVRGVVAGYRVADLGGEIEGARSVLRSAGTAVEIIGAEDGAGLPQGVQEALAWVVRESVTNVVRHAAAAHCTIELRVNPPGSARLEVRNDGVGRAPRARGGSGLAGLRERLAPLGGDLETTLDGEWYTLSAVLPVTEANTSTIERGPS
ncbi:sensor histidine kinase [Bogoriella caseilytica]|uniref:sensor histidine kinase n=1 Tax=Bogoriella caseilytica TaxID=56055 RepID=UPI0014739247|nr:sensor histidine kinase [Bogoriella caseilytica]